MNYVTSQNILEQDISTLFGLGSLSEDEKTELLDNIGSIIMESASLRFMVESDEKTVSQFEEIIEANAENENMINVLLETFPRFGEILEEEVVAFKEQALEVLGT